MRRGLIPRVLGASMLVMLVVGAVFAVLLRAIDTERDSALLARHSHEVISTANRLEGVVVDLETGTRGFLLTGEERFLEPWEAARAAIPAESNNLQRLTVTPGQSDQSRWVVQAHDGLGGADPARGSGLVGLTNRVEALGGSITVGSPPGRGTSLQAELPIESA